MEYRKQTPNCNIAKQDGKKIQNRKIYFEPCSCQFLPIKTQRTNDLFKISKSAKLLRMKREAKKPIHPQMLK